VTTNAAAFNREVAMITKNMGAKQVTTLQRILAFQALDGLVYATPVDTGRARGNWQVSIGAPPGGEVYSGLPSSGGEKKGIDGNAKAAESRVESTEKPKIGVSPPFCTIFIGNNVPYIEVLNEPRKSSYAKRTGKYKDATGHSVQNNPYWFQRTFAAISAAAKQRILTGGLGGVT